MFAMNHCSEERQRTEVPRDGMQAGCQEKGCIRGHILASSHCFGLRLSWAEREVQGCGAGLKGGVEWLGFARV